MNQTESRNGESIADLIPRWFEGGTTEQMLDEALAQIRMLENGLMSAQPLEKGDSNVPDYAALYSHSANDDMRSMAREVIRLREELKASRSEIEPTQAMREVGGEEVLRWIGGSDACPLDQEQMAASIFKAMSGANRQGSAE